MVQVLHSPQSLHDQYPCDSADYLPCPSPPSCHMATCSKTPRHSDSQIYMFAPQTAHHQGKTKTLAEQFTCKQEASDPTNISGSCKTHSGCRQTHDQTHHAQTTNTSKQSTIAQPLRWSQCVLSTASNLCSGPEPCVPDQGPFHPRHVSLGSQRTQPTSGAQSTCVC